MLPPAPLSPAGFGRPSRLQIAAAPGPSGCYPVVRRRRRESPRISVQEPWPAGVSQRASESARRGDSSGHHRGRRGRPGLSPSESPRDCPGPCSVQVPALGAVEVKAVAFPVQGSRTPGRPGLSPGGSNLKFPRPSRRHCTARLEKSSHRVPFPTVLGR